MSIDLADRPIDVCVIPRLRRKSLVIARRDSLRLLIFIFRVPSSVRGSLHKEIAMDRVVRIERVTSRSGDKKNRISPQVDINLQIQHMGT
ncbi:hypothetical protein FP2506_15964 [Fulvimarina pelagi HTCC2506]|uniref:Uncharacterized protein n=1 Tax=Fulvimarina pelagi HTCC2506 TaxID=314231 RepID=Q0G387_9HYPH|nr:hypothetical protein FP2506_15964 [Fulvimarina pelagi HTCC2506]